MFCVATRAGRGDTVAAGQASPHAGRVPSGRRRHVSVNTVTTLTATGGRRPCEVWPVCGNRAKRQFGFSVTCWLRRVAWRLRGEFSGQNSCTGENTIT